MGTTTFLLLSLLACFALAGLIYNRDIPQPEQPGRYQNIFATKINGYFLIERTISGDLEKGINAKIMNSKLTIEGCNTMWATFTYDQNTGFFKIGEFSTTNSNCQYSLDQEIAQSFSVAVKVYRKQSQIFFLNEIDRQVLMLRQVGAYPDEEDFGSDINFGLQSLQLSSYTDIEGHYTISKINLKQPVTKFEASLQNNNIRIHGCNTFWSSYLYDKRTSYWRVGQFYSTKVGCSINEDSLVTEALQRAITAFYEDRSLYFVNGDDQAIMQFQLVSRLDNLQPKQKQSQENQQQQLQSEENNEQE